MVGNPGTVIFYVKLPDQQRISVIGPCSFSFATKVMLLLLQKYRTSVTCAFHFFGVRPAVQQPCCWGFCDIYVITSIRYLCWNRIYIIYVIRYKHLFTRTVYYPYIPAIDSIYTFASAYFPYINISFVTYTLQRLHDYTIFSSNRRFTVCYTFYTILFLNRIFSVHATGLTRRKNLVKTFFAFPLISSRVNKFHSWLMTLLMPTTKTST